MSRNTLRAYLNECGFFLVDDKFLETGGQGQEMRIMLMEGIKKAKRDGRKDMKGLCEGLLRGIPVPRL